MPGVQIVAMRNQADADIFMGAAIAGLIMLAVVVVVLVVTWLVTRNRK